MTIKQDYYNRWVTGDHVFFYIFAGVNSQHRLAGKHKMDWLGKSVAVNIYKMLLKIEMTFSFFLLYILLAHEGLEYWQNSAHFSRFKVHATFCFYWSLCVWCVAVKWHFVTLEFWHRLYCTVTSDKTLQPPLYRDPSPLIYCDIDVYYASCISCKLSQ